MQQSGDIATCSCEVKGGFARCEIRYQIRLACFRVALSHVIAVAFVGKALFRQARYLLIDIGLVLRKAFLVG